MNNHTVRPNTLACRDAWWGAGTPTASRGDWGQGANNQTGSRSSGGGPDLRVSDGERQETAEHLKAAVAAGRLDMDEYDERLQQALAAKTGRDLDDLVRDLTARQDCGHQAVGVAGRSLRPSLLPWP